MPTGKGLSAALGDLGDGNPDLPLSGSLGTSTRSLHPSRLCSHLGTESKAGQGLPNVPAGLTGVQGKGKGKIWVGCQLLEPLNGSSSPWDIPAFPGILIRREILWKRSPPWSTQSKSMPGTARAEGTEKPGMAKFLGKASPGTRGMWLLFTGSWTQNINEDFWDNSIPRR